MQYFDLGSFSWPVTTPSPDAQLWFDGGMTWCYGFNHEDAICCFGRALRHDPNFAMAHWGIAYAVGPNYNKSWDDFDDDNLRASLLRARAEMAVAENAATNASDIERRLIGALAHRCPPIPLKPKPDYFDLSELGPGDFACWNDAYAMPCAMSTCRTPAT